MKIILASASPRRKELLNMLYDNFLTVPADIEEKVQKYIALEKVAETLAIQKAQYVANKYTNCLVIGCDTTVVTDTEILGKPKNKNDGIRMLKMLSGKTHQVITGVAICYKGKTRSFSQVTRVTFYELSDVDIEKYIDTGEPYDKAGSYGIQGRGGLFVEKIAGDYFNVVGLPVARLKRELEEMRIGE